MLRLKLPAIVLFLACLAATYCIDCSDYHDDQNADSMMPVLLSLYNWDLFLWGQSRLGTFIPTIATPFHNPFTNLLVQNAIGIFGVFLFFGAISWYILRNEYWPMVASVAIVIFLLAYPRHERFHLFNGSNPYPIPMALALFGIVAMANTRWWWIFRFVLGIALTMFAYWYNAGVHMLIVPFCGLRMIFACFAAGPGPDGVMNKVKHFWNAGIRECLYAAILCLFGAAFGYFLSLTSTYPPIMVKLVPLAEWPSCWEVLVKRSNDRFGNYFNYVAWSTAAGLIWLVIPSTRAAFVRWLVPTLFVLIWAVSLLWIAGMIEWIRKSDYDIRYIFGGIMVLSLAPAMLLFGPILEVIHRRIAFSSIIIALMIPFAAIIQYGIPSVDRARTSIDHVCGRYTEEIIDAKCTHIVGNYWDAWEAMFHVNMTRYERGIPGVVWAATDKGQLNIHVWPIHHPTIVRLAHLKRSGKYVMYLRDDLDWRWAFPYTNRVERRETIDVLVPFTPK